MNTSCPMEAFTIPLTVLRVVCGTGETMETFPPQTVFKKVDFPAEGLPIMATVADFCFSVLPVLLIGMSITCKVSKVHIIPF